MWTAWGICWDWKLATLWKLSGHRSVSAFCATDAIGDLFGRGAEFFERQIPEIELDHQRAAHCVPPLTA